VAAAPWAIRWTQAAHRDVRRLDRELTGRILSTLERFASTGHGDVTRLQTVDPPTWRIRIGDWRVLFALFPAERTLEVQRVLPRGSAYRD
jgi:mRNA-degrading endonuclease RelE of RelBE toxin-antitoxin system